MHALGSKLVDPLIVSLLAEGYVTAGRYEEGVALLDASLTSFARDGRVSFEPDHLRLRAAMVLGLDPAAHHEALEWLMRSVEVARSHGACSFELRAALAAGRILRELRRDDEARELVASAYAGFTEGFDDPDLRDARTFLS